MVAKSRAEVNFWVGVPMCDWLTLGSFDDAVSRGFFEYVRDLSIDGKMDEDAKVMQYEGVRVGGVFAGMALQAEKQHGLLSAGGAVAHEAMMHDFSMAGVEARCTRIDLQLTVPIDEEYSARRLTDLFRDGKWSRKGPSPHVDIYDSQLGKDTIYVGARSSDRFWRVYVKAGDGRDYLRFEVEYKSDRARLALAEIKEDQASIGRILLAEWKNAPAVDDKTWNLFGEVLEAYGAGIDLPVPQEKVSTDRTFRWMIKILFPVLKRMLYDHDYGWRTRKELIEMLIEYDDNVDG